MKSCFRSKGFSLIELMVAMVISVLIFGSFFAIYNNTLKKDKRLSQKTSINIKGEKAVSILSAAMQDIGLNTTTTEMGSFIPIDTATGYKGTGTNMDFTFSSPYGGPVTRIESVTGSDQSCTFTLESYSSVTTDIDKLRLVSASGEIFFADVSSVDPSSGVITTSTITSDTGSPSGACDVNFPVGNLVTGEPIKYRFYKDSSDNYKFEDITDPTNIKPIFSFTDDEAPLVVLEFLKEDKSSGNNEWTDQLFNQAAYSSPDSIYRIKAVRFGFIFASQRTDKTQKKLKKSSISGVTPPEYSLFNESLKDNEMDLKKQYTVYTKTIYLRNFYYLCKLNGDCS